jgi:hypothetical protein
MTHVLDTKGGAAELQKRLAFEQRIKRPYFHVKPLDSNQLSNWRSYLDFEEQQEDKVRRTEAPLIACHLLLPALADEGREALRKVLGGMR